MLVYSLVYYHAFLLYHIKKTHNSFLVRAPSLTQGVQRCYQLPSLEFYDLRLMQDLLLLPCSHQQKVYPPFQLVCVLPKPMFVNLTANLYPSAHENSYSKPLRAMITGLPVAPSIVSLKCPASLLSDDRCSRIMSLTVSVFSLAR